MTELNKVKEAIRELFLLTRDGDGFTGDDWSIDYNLDLDSELFKELNSLHVEIELLTNAVKEKDFVTIKCALIMARLHALNLSNLFLNLFEDIEKIGWSEEYKLPNIPDDYQIPEIYNYPKK